MAAFLTVLTVIGSLAGGFIFIAGSVAANGAPQEASAAAMGMAAALIPYVLLRCAHMGAQRAWQAEMLAAGRSSEKAHVPATADEGKLELTPGAQIVRS